MKALFLFLLIFSFNFNLFYNSNNNICNYLLEEDLEKLMVPIPKEDRVFNKTGIQCVWASIESLGRFAGEGKLLEITKHEDCQGYASPVTLALKLKALGVDFKQTTNKKDKSLLIQSVVNDRRGCLFGIPGHAMVLVHYDEKESIVKYINNSDKNLKVRTWSLEEFNQRWDGWICVIYPENDIIYKKYNNCPIPIIDRNLPQGNYEKDYIIKPLQL